jgi:putative ABC transport system ATP-binding protein
MFHECQRTGSTLIFVSHDASLAPLFDRALALPDINRTVADR